VQRRHLPMTEDELADAYRNTGRTNVRGLRCEYVIVPWIDGRPELLEGALVIRDSGHETKMTVTNDAEAVVAHLMHAGDLSYGQRLFYFDSEDKLDEICHDGTKFTHMQLGPSQFDGVWRTHAEEA
jgi:hypothetical protein